MTIENRFDVPLISQLALREKQIQQHYRPIIAVHKWFARRPGSLFRALTLSEFGDAPLEESYFTASNFPGRQVLDPFMGGGTPLIEANRLGCDVAGYDVNPMAAWIVREEIEHLDVNRYRDEAMRLLGKLEEDIGELYYTDCPLYGDTDVPVKYFLWVKTLDCQKCGSGVDLFPGYLIAEDSRHPENILVCPACGGLNEVKDVERPGLCRHCSEPLQLRGPAKRGRCRCPHCNHENEYPRPDLGPLRHRLFAIEYYNPGRKNGHKGRFFKKPDAKDLARVSTAQARWQQQKPRFVPNQPILPGDETDRLHRWGYSHYREMFNDRQLLGLELSCLLIYAVGNERIRHALATNLSDLLRYQNMMCRYDTWALKSLDIFSVHGFPVSLVQCESNILGIANGKKTSVGSGGWRNIIDKYAKAKEYCATPFEVQRIGKRNVKVPVQGEWIGERLNGAHRRQFNIHCEDATGVTLAPNSLDAIFTDPPYFGNVQYGELMDFCYVWLRALIGSEAEGFHRPSTRAAEELTGNVTSARRIEQFTEGLAAVYSRMTPALKAGAPLAFTYHHNKLDAYCAVGVAILDAGLTCSASLPCPAEMGGSIHIHGTTSSIVDTVFVCRKEGETLRRWLFEGSAELREIVRTDLAELSAGGRKPTRGDTRCIVFGHLTRMTVWNLRRGWDVSRPTLEKLEMFREALTQLVSPEEFLDWVQGMPLSTSSDGPTLNTVIVREGNLDAVAF
jgi:adenine-specific DNA methylase